MLPISYWTCLLYTSATPIFNGANEKDIQDTLELANDYVNLEWDEFKEKHGEELLPEVLDYLYENRDHRKLWKGVPISKEGKVRLRDGRTGEEFDSMVTIGHMHYLKLHLSLIHIWYAVRIRSMPPVFGFRPLRLTNRLKSVF